MASSSYITTRQPTDHYDIRRWRSSSAPFPVGEEDEDARTIHKVAREIIGGRIHGFSMNVEDGVAMKAIGTLCAEFADIMRDKAKYREMISNRGGNAQKLVNIVHMLLDHPLLDHDLKSSLLKVLTRVSTKAGLFPTCLTLYDVRFEREPVSDGFLSQIWKGTFQKHSVALKVIKIYRERDVDDLLKSLRREGLLWAHLSHPNIVPFYGIYHLHDMDEQVCLVSPWMKQGNILHFLSMNSRADRVFEISKGISYLHANNIIHGDLKGANVLISDSGRAVLCDFGLSTVTLNVDIMAYTSVETIPHCGGTLRYQAPELFAEEDATDPKLTKESDVYAFACLCYEVFTNKVPFYDIPFDPTVLVKVCNGDRPARPVEQDLSWSHFGLTIEIWTLVEKCWDQIPSLRPSSTDTVETLRSQLKEVDITNTKDMGDLATSATFRRPLYDATNMLSSRFNESNTTDYLKKRLTLLPNNFSGMPMWRVRSILMMRMRDPSLHSNSTGECSLDYASVRLNAPSILCTPSTDTFFAESKQIGRYKVLLLGTSQSGKSTIVKQLKIAYGEGFSYLEKQAWFSVIYRTFVGAVQTVVRYMAEKSINVSSREGKKSFELLYSIKDYSATYDEDYVPSVLQFLNDPSVVKVLNSDWARYILDTSKKYFLNQASRFNNRIFIANDDDIIYAKNRTNKVDETALKLNNVEIGIYEVGGARSERQKIMTQLETTTSVIFCAALDDYYKVTSDEKSTNRMKESIELFQSIHCQPLLSKKPTILLLNKFDVFKEIISEIPLKDPDYQGGKDVSKAVGFILETYKKNAEPLHKPVYTHIIQATDRRNVQMVFRTVRDEILMMALEDHVDGLRLLE